MTKEQMKAEIIKMVGTLNHVSFAEITNKFPKENGHHFISAPGRPKTILWVGLSEKLSRAVVECLDEGSVVAASAPLLLYIIDGKTLGLPVAKTAKVYKKDHWLPVVLTATTKKPNRQKRGVDP